MAIDIFIVFVQNQSAFTTYFRYVNIQLAQYEIMLLQKKGELEKKAHHAQH